ncbi:MAG TPA: hypothetical protein VM490_19870 [Armatimonadaceae bacterium]|nr:hypothetical protein [Armatimonadaceae bacterium]
METSQALETVAFWAGLTFGLTWAAVLYVLHVMTGGPIQEAIQEGWEAMQRQRRRQKRAAAPEAAARGFGVLVSDLHIDTWFGPRATALPDQEGKFVAFLAAVKAHPEIDSFYLAGDLMDIPLHPASHDEDVMLTLSPETLEDRGVLLPVYDRVLGLLNDLTVPAPEGAPDAGRVARSVFMTGNHDVGISGARYVRVKPPMPPYAPNAQIAWSPSLLVRHAPSGTRYERPFYVAHGHLLDPLLWLYLRYALLDALRQGYRHREEQIVTGFQRGGSVGGENAPPLRTRRRAASACWCPTCTSTPGSGRAPPRFRARKGSSSRSLRR